MSERNEVKKNSLFGFFLYCQNAICFITLLLQPFQDQMHNTWLCFSKLILCFTFADPKDDINEEDFVPPQFTPETKVAPPHYTRDIGETFRYNKSYSVPSIVSPQFEF